MPEDKTPSEIPWHRKGLMPAFALWWADHAPKATQAEAWDEWIGLLFLEDGPPYEQEALDAAVKQAVAKERARCLAIVEKCYEQCKAHRDAAKEAEYLPGAAAMSSRMMELAVVRGGIERGES